VENKRRFFRSGLIVMGDLPVSEKTWKFFSIDLIVMGDLSINERYEDCFQVSLIPISDLPRWKTQRVLMWWVTFLIEKFEDFSSGLINMGGLPWSKFSQKCKIFRTIFNSWPFQGGLPFLRILSRISLMNFQNTLFNTLKLNDMHAS